MIIINGREGAEGRLIFDDGLQFGRGLFETILVKEAPIFLTEHLARLNQGLLTLGIQRHIDQTELLDLTKKFGIRQCALKLIATEQNTILTTREISYTAQHYETGLTLVLGTLRRNPTSPTTYLKSLNYLDNIKERDNARQLGYDEALLLNFDGQVAEGTISNIFWVKQDIIYTPAVSCGLLPGIMRGLVISHHQIQEGAYPLAELLGADEVFITNSLMGIMPVRSIGDTAFALGEVAASLHSKFSQLAAADKQAH